MSESKSGRNPANSFEQRGELHAALTAFTTYGAFERYDESTYSSSQDIRLSTDAVLALPETVTRHFTETPGEDLLRSEDGRLNISYYLSGYIFSSHGSSGLDEAVPAEGFPDAVSLKYVSTINGWAREEQVEYEFRESNPENLSGIRRHITGGYVPDLGFMLGVRPSEDVAEPMSLAELDRAIDMARQNLANIENPPMLSPEVISLENELTSPARQEIIDLITLLHSQTGPWEGYS